MSDFIKEWVLSDKEQAASNYADAAESKHSCNPYLTGCCFSEYAIEMAFIKGCDWANARAEKKAELLFKALSELADELDCYVNEDVLKDWEQMFAYKEALRLYRDNGGGE